MKNNFLIMIKMIILIIIFSSHLNLYANEILFESNEIEIIDKDNLIAKGDIKINNNLGYEIKGDKLIINKRSQVHVLLGNVYFKDNFHNTIYSKKIIINQKENKYIFSENVLLQDNIHEIILKSQNLVYDRASESIFLNEKAEIIDSLDNKIETETLKINIKDNLLIGKNVKIIDKDLNTYEIKNIIYDLKNKKIAGQDLSLNSNNTRLSKNYVPRAKSRAFIIEDDFLTLNKSNYTNCRARDGCPPWTISADEILHDKKNKIVKYKNASLKIYDKPIVYFPKFFHPDPSVERQSGFLPPVISTQNSNSFLNLPYFFAISDNTDFTLNPRIYDNEKSLLQGEYRKITKNSLSTLDMSIKNDSPFLMKNKSTDTHLFLKSKINKKFNFFDESNFDIKLQLTSNDDYLKTYNLKSPIIESQSTLNSAIEFEGSNNDLYFNLSAEAYEDLTKTHDKFEYVLPNFLITKDLDSQFNGLLQISSNGYNKFYDTNVKETILINDFSYNSLDNFSNQGFISNFEFKVKNFNSSSSNSNTYKKDQENNIQGLIQYNSKYPLIKKGNKYDRTLTPLLSLKLNPLGNDNISEADRLITYDNIFSSNRISSNEILEGGISLTFGNEFKIFKKNDEINDFFHLNLATSIRENENYDLPQKSSLGQKTSNFVGQTGFNINEFLDLNYEFITENNLTESNYHKIESILQFNKIVTKFEYLEENNQIGNESFFSNETKFLFDENSNVLFRTRKNKKTDLTEYYDLIYQYKMDCLTAGVEYKKSYYNDGSLKPEESIYFSLTLMPFNNEIKTPGIDR